MHTKVRATTGLQGAKNKCKCTGTTRAGRICGVGGARGVRVVWVVVAGERGMVAHRLPCVSRSHLSTRRALPARSQQYKV